jgi:hypothetical protein
VVTFAVLLYGVLSFETACPARFEVISERPLVGWALAATLLYRPGMFGILPIFIVFVLSVPLLLMLLRKGHDQWLLLGSFFMWLAAQFRIGTILMGRFLPEPEMFESRFELFAWQFLFVLGFWLGYRVIYEGSMRIPKRRYLVLLSSVFALAMFLYRWGFIRWDLLETRFFRNAIRGDNLGWIRLLNFLALAYLAKRLVDRLGGFFRNAWLELLGRHSLQVFCFHILASYGQRIIQKRLLIEGNPGKVVLTAVVAASLTIPALLHQYIRLLFHKSRNRASPEVGS